MPQIIQNQPKPISITFDQVNSQLVALCDDGSLWWRIGIVTDDKIGFQWVKREQFNGGNDDAKGTSKQHRQARGA